MLRQKEHIVSSFNLFDIEKDFECIWAHIIAVSESKAGSALIWSSHHKYMYLFYSIRGE